MTVQTPSALPTTGHRHRSPVTFSRAVGSGPARGRRLTTVAALTLALALAGCSSEPDNSELHELLDGLPGVESVTVPCVPNEVGPAAETCTVEIEVAAGTSATEVAEIIRSAKTGTQQMIATVPTLHTVAGSPAPSITLTLGTLAELRAEELGQLWVTTADLEGASAVDFEPVGEVGVEKGVQDYAAHITVAGTADEATRASLSEAFADSEQVVSTELG